MSDIFTSEVVGKRFIVKVNGMVIADEPMTRNLIIIDDIYRNKKYAFSHFVRIYKKAMRETETKFMAELNRFKRG